MKYRHRKPWKFAVVKCRTQRNNLRLILPFRKWLQDFKLIRENCRRGKQLCKKPGRISARKNNGILITIHAVSTFLNSNFHRKYGVWRGVQYSKIPILRPPLRLSKSGLKDHFWTVPNWFLIKGTLSVENKETNNLNFADKVLNRCLNFRWS